MLSGLPDICNKLVLYLNKNVFLGVNIMNIIKILRLFLSNNPFFPEIEHLDKTKAYNLNFPRARKTQNIVLLF